MNSHPGPPPQGWAPQQQQQQQHHHQQPPPQHQQQYQQIPAVPQQHQPQFPPQQMHAQQPHQQHQLQQGPPQVLKGPPPPQANVPNGNGTHQLISNLGQMNLGGHPNAPPAGANTAYPPQQQAQQPAPNQARPPNMMSPQPPQPQQQLPPQQQQQPPAPTPQQQHQQQQQQQPNFGQQQQPQQHPFGAAPAQPPPASDIPVSATAPPGGPFGQPAQPPPPQFKELPNNSTLPPAQPPPAAAQGNAFAGAFPPQRYNAGPPQGSAMPPAPQGNLPPGHQGHLPPGPQAHLPPGGAQSHGFLPPGPQGHLPPGPQGHLPPGPQGHLPPGPQGYPQPGPQGNMPPGPHMPPPVSQQHNPNGPHMPPAQYGGNMPPMPNRGPPGHPSQPGYAGQPGYGAPPGHYPQPGHGQHNGMPGHHAGPGHYPAPNAAEPPRRLDPDNMPNPIQVMSENQRTITGPFLTNQAGLVPPLVTTKFVTHDQGNSGPKFIRSTMYNVPNTTDIMKQTQVPFALIVSPFAVTGPEEIVPPIVDFGAIGPIRCGRCKAYMSPNMQFIDAGRRFQCMLCKATTEVPQEYFQHLDHTGQRVDKFERPELVLGTYEFVATQDYCRTNKKPTNAPALIFVIDVSYNNIKSGLVKLICSEMKSIISKLPIDQGADRTAMKVGFITYNNSVHFYNIKNNLAVPQMMVVGDINEIFMPLLDGFLCDAEESSTVIDILMEQIPTMFAETRETETILMPAIQAGLEALKASDCAGKLLVFHSSLPVSEAPGKLKNRDDRNVLGTEKEKTVLSPQCTTYNNLGQDCVQNGCSVDLFIFNNSYIDLATIGQICRLTGGEIYKYTYFQADLDGERLIRDVQKNVASTYAFDTVMRVRTSTGVRPTDFFGHFFMSNTTDMEIAHIDRNKSVAIEIKHDDKLPPDENVYIQVAVLYTSCGGQRRLRILNLALTTCTQMSDLFRCGDLDAVVLFFAKRIMFKILESTPRAIKEELEQRCAQILACYRKNCASPTSAGQLILPECMKLLPLYVSCLLKNDAVSGGSDMTCDDRSYAMQFVLTMDLPTSVSFFYPRLIPIHNVEPNETGIPSQIRTSIDKITDDGAYILENGVHMFVWLGLALAPEFVQSVFGAPCSQQVDTETCRLPRFDNALSQRVHQIIDQIQTEKPHCMRITLVRQRDKLENVFKHFLIEDAGLNGAASYVDYLCHLHKEIRSLLSFGGK